MMQIVIENFHVILLAFAFVGISVWMVVDIVRPRKLSADVERKAQYYENQNHVLRQDINRLKREKKALEIRISELRKIAKSPQS